MEKQTTYGQNLLGLLSKKHTAAFLGISITTLDRIIARGEISYVRVGLRKIGFLQSEIDSYTAQHTKNVLQMMEETV